MLPIAMRHAVSGCASWQCLNMHDTTKKFKIELLGFMGSVFYVLYRVVTMNSFQDIDFSVM